MSNYSGSKSKALSWKMETNEEQPMESHGKKQLKAPPPVAALSQPAPVNAGATSLALVPPMQDDHSMLSNKSLPLAGNMDLWNEDFSIDLSMEM